MADAVAVTFVSSHARLGGEENYLLRLIGELGPDWVREVVCLEDAPFVERLRAQGIPTEVIPTGRRAGIVTGAWRLRRALRRSQPEVVHANGVKAAVVCALAMVGMRTSLVWVKHDFSWDGRLARAVGRRCGAIVGVSHAVTETFQGKTREKVTVVHNGLPPLQVDRDEGRRKLQELLGGDVGRVVSLVARIDPTKGHRELLGVLPGLPEDTRVAFIGDEHVPHLEFAAELRAEIGAQGLEDRVAFLGFRDDAVDLIAGSDVLVIPSTIEERGLGREGFPYVGLEAMAVGTPVVGYAHGGLPEMLGDCGRLVAPDDRAALRSAITEVLTDAELRDRIARCGRARVQELFSLAKMVDAMRARYREVA